MSDVKDKLKLFIKQNLQKTVIIKTSPQKIEEYPPCRVCEGKSTGYHYGVLTCEPCKVWIL